MPTMLFFNLCYKTKKGFRSLGNTGLWCKVPSCSWVITQGFGFSLSLPYDNPPQQNLNIFRPLSSLKKNQSCKTCLIPYGPSAMTLSDSLLKMRSLKTVFVFLMIFSVRIERSCRHPVQNDDTSPRRNYPSAVTPLPTPWQPLICCVSGFTCSLSILGKFWKHNLSKKSPSPFYTLFSEPRAFILFLYHYSSNLLVKLSFTLYLIYPLS